MALLSLTITSETSWMKEQTGKDLFIAGENL